MRIKVLVVMVAVLVAPLLYVTTTTAQVSAEATGQPVDGTFTYQGQLQDSAGPVTDTCAMQFDLYDAATGGTQIGNTLSRQVSVEDGLFTVQLDFGSGAFDGEARWLEIAVTCPAGSGSATTLSPRQALTAAPYAHHAAQADEATHAITADNATNATSADEATHAITADSATSATSADAAPWSGLTGVPAGLADGDDDTTYEAGTGLVRNASDNSFSLDTSFTDDRYWRQGGNAIGAANAELGTTTETALTVVISDRVALRLQPTGSSPNIIGGYSGNDVAPDVYGATIGGGGGLPGPTPYTNTVTAPFGTISGGVGNTGSGWASTVGGGFNNSASGTYAAIGGGWTNSADALHSTVGGGRLNTAGDQYATVGGGHKNDATNIHATVSGGTLNLAGDQYATVGGGSTNEATATSATVSGGRSNSASGVYATVGGGRFNLADAAYATIAGGGPSNPALGTTSNRVTDEYGTIGGGGNNQAGDADSDATNASHATVAGGYSNKASAGHATVSGGSDNRATMASATVGGGHKNVASEIQATVGGGQYNFAKGRWSTVPGGYESEARKDYSFAAGRRAKANHKGAFVWADSTDADFGSRALNQFAVRASGGFRFKPGGGVTCSLPSGASGWSCTSDRNAKTDITPVDGQAVLEQVATLPMQTWRYKGADPSIRNIGPMAQDFYAAFEVGHDNRTLSAANSSGVALAAIQGLYELVREKGARVTVLEAQNAELAEQNADLEAENAAQQEQIDALAERLEQLEQAIETSQTEGNR